MGQNVILQIARKPLGLAGLGSRPGSTANLSRFQVRKIGANINDTLTSWHRNCVKDCVAGEEVYYCRMLLLTQKEIELKLDRFNWNFKVGDNIKHNLEEVFYLYKVRDRFCSNSLERQFLNKHISITLVAIIEVIFHDFIVRLSEATNHFPLIIDDRKRNEIKKDISNQKVSVKSKITGGKNMRIKNYSLTEILRILQKYELLEQKDSPVYKNLEKATQFRNRIHIYNWHNNFEIDEKDVFTEKRLRILEKILVYVITTMEAKYARP